MAETAKRDPNYVTTLMGVDMTTGLVPTNVFVDESTHRLLVSAIITGGSPGGTEYTEGDVDTTFSGFMMMAEAPGNVAIPIQADASGVLQASATIAKDNLPIASATQAIATALVDSAGNQISTFGGGAQYTEGDVDATVTGTVSMMEVAGNTMQPIQGTVADGLLVNLGSNNDVTVTGVSTAANQTTIIGHLDGVEGLLTTIDADTSVLITPIATIGTTPLQRVAIFDAANNQITTFGGGTQYTEGDTDATITGTAMMMEVAANVVQPVQGTVADGLLVNLGANNDVTVSGVSTSANQTTIIGHLDGVEGLLTTIDTDTGNIATSVASIDTKTPALGQALAASSVPVVLTAAQLTTLTPPAAITGFATAANQTTIIGHLDGVEGLLTTIDADTGSILLAVDGLEASNSAIQTAVELIDDTVKVLGTDTYTETTSKAVIIGGVRRDADTTLANTTNEFAPFQLDANGYLKVEIFDGGGSHTVDNAGTFAVQVDGSALTALQNIDTDATTIIGHLDGVEGLLTTIDADTGILSGAVSGGRMLTDTVLKPATTGGYTTYHLVSAGTTNATVVKASAGQLYGWYIYNSNAAARKLVFHNTASVPTAGASVFFSIVLPPGAGANVFNQIGIPFSSGIAITTVTGLADSDTTAVAANDLIINLFYA